MSLDFANTRAKLVRIVFTITTGVLFAVSVSPTMSMLAGPLRPPSRVFPQLAVTVLAAGVGTGRPDGAESIVYWTDLNTDNTCQVGTTIREEWAIPHGMCTFPCAENENGGCFELPSNVQFKRVMPFITLGLAFTLFIAQAVDLAMCGTLWWCWLLQLALSVLVMCCAVVTFPFWTTTGLGETLYYHADVIPVWAPPDFSTRLEVSPDTYMDPTTGYFLQCAGLACATVGVCAWLIPPIGSNGNKNNASRQQTSCCGKNQDPPPPPPEQQTVQEI